MTLLGVGEATLDSLYGGVLDDRLADATMERISHVLAIYSALQVLLPVPERADTWIRRPSAAPLSGGRTALNRMMGGQVSDLLVVQQYLDAQIQG